MVGPLASSSAMRSASPCSIASSNTRLTSPQASAVSAGSRSPRSDNSMARAGQVAQPPHEGMKYGLQGLTGAARDPVLAAPLQVGAGRKRAPGSGQHQT